MLINMAREGFNTGFEDENGNPILVGDQVAFCGEIGKADYCCGAFGFTFKNGVPWDAIEQVVRETTGNEPHFLYNDNFVSFWEIIWNLCDGADDRVLPNPTEID